MTYYIGPAEDPDRYHLEQLVARGGEGELWKASITVDGVPLPVAAKLLAAQGGAMDDWVQRWRRQTEILRTLDHPNLVKVREVFTGPAPHVGGGADQASVGLFLIMNWVSGTNLEGWVAQNPQRDLLDSLRVIGPVAAALDYMHGGAATGSPILHRDIKPSNVVVDPVEGVKLVDFGFAHLGSRPAMTLVGTPAFLAPEVVAGAPATEASDRFSLGATAYFALTGEIPDPGDFAGCRSRLLAVRGTSGRTDIADHVLAMMNPDPAMRPAGAVSWAQTLAATAVSGTYGGGALPPGPPPTVAATGVSPPPGPAPLVVTASPTPVPRSPVPPARLPDPPPTGGGKGRKKLRVVAAAVVVVAVAAVAAVLLLGGKSGGEPRATADHSAARTGDRGHDDGGGGGSDETTTTTVDRSEVPDVTGMSLSDATARLEKLGITVKTESVLDESKTDGTVLDQDPAGGSGFADSVMLSVARQPVLTYLTDMEPVSREGGAEAGARTVEIDGKQYPQSLSWTCGYSDCTGGGASAEYNLSRAYRRFQATIGLGDTSASDGVLIFRVLGDGRVLVEKQLGLGKPDEVDVDVTGVLRLRLLAVSPQEASGSVYASWGSAHLLGSPDEVPEPTTTTTGY